MGRSGGDRQNTALARSIVSQFNFSLFGKGQVQAPCLREIFVPITKGIPRFLRKTDAFSFSSDKKISVIFCPVFNIVLRLPEIFRV